MTQRKERALQALILCRTRAEAAKQAGVGESTIREYLKDPEFLDRYRQACGDILRDAANQARQGISPALHTLREIAEEPGNPQARVMAARSSLEYGLRIIEQVDILERVEALERSVNNGT